MIPFIEIGLTTRYFTEVEPAQLIGIHGRPRLLTLWVMIDAGVYSNVCQCLPKWRFPNGVLIKGVS